MPPYGLAEPKPQGRLGLRPLRGYSYDYNFTGIYVKPSEKSIKHVKETIKQIFSEHKGKNAQDLIGKLNPVIRG